MRQEWKTTSGSYPNGLDYKITSIDFGLFGDSYHHVDGGFRRDRWNRSHKTYVTESEIRGVILRKLQKQVRDIEARIAYELESVL